MTLFSDHKGSVICAIAQVAEMGFHSFDCFDEWGEKIILL